MALNAWPTALALLAGAALWEAMSYAWSFSFHPSLGEIAQAVWRLLARGEISHHLVSSATALTMGFAASVVVGIPVGLAMGRFRSIGSVLDPYFDAIVAAPSLLFVPIFFGMFGLGRATFVATVFLDSFVTIAIMTRSGLATVTPEQVEMARAFGASESQIFRRLLFPGALPTIMTGLRLGVSRAVRALISAEVVLGVSGLGALLRLYGGRFDAASMFGVLAVVVAFSLAANYAVIVVDRRLNHWAN